ncbi:MAG: site-specific DNA-methyltransferase [Erysipelotrichaceae bacterium]|nr:site-specific DNA-methyltransferase [Erysipelotrichaceae bacterium]
MPIKYVPYLPTPIEGQAVLSNFLRTKRMLSYRGADGVYERILRGMPYYELERVETVGKNNPFENLLIHGECISTCAYLKDKGIKVDLVYIDPPFASGADYAKKIYIRRNPLVAKAIKQAEEELDNSSASEFEEKMYGDIWDKEKFLNWMYENLVAIKSIMSEDASIYMHLDWHIGHYVKVLMDEIFGEDNFRNEIIWHYQTFQGQIKEYFPRKHDTLFLYAKSKNPCFHLLKDSNAKDTIDYTRWNSYLNENNEILGSNYPKTDSRFDGYLRRFVEENGRKPGPKDVILKIEGNTVDSVWDIKAVDPKNKSEKVDYATQKPEELLERVIRASSNEGMIVADFFGGSGVTAAVANKLKRKFITCDVGVNSIQTIRDRLICDKASFEIYEIKDGVNLFRNPVQTMNKLVKLIPGLQIDDSLPKFWTGHFVDSKLGKIPAYIQDLKDSSSKIFDIVKLNEIINERIPELEEGFKKVVVYYVDISNEEEIKEFVKNNNLTGVDIEFRDLKSILALTFEDDYLEYEVVEESSNIFASKQLVIKKFISDRLKQKIDEFNDKALAQAIENPEKAKTIKLSNEGLEGIELISVDCTSNEGEWHADVELKIEKDNSITLNGEKSKDGWDGKVPLENDPLRIKVRNILGDETIIVCKS